MSLQTDMDGDVVAIGMAAIGGLGMLLMTIGALGYYIFKYLTTP